MLQRLLRTVAQLQARSDEHSRLSAEAETRHRLAEERHAEAMKMTKQREEELRQQIASLKARNEQEQEDPHAHLQAFQTQMYISGGDDKLSCKLFLGTLRGVALQWIMNLPPRSIYAFGDLAGLFLPQFAANKPKRLEVADLFDIKQAGGESLKSYMARFSDATMRVNDPDQKFFVKAFQKGLRVGPISDALALQKPTSMEEIHVRAEKHVEMEESRFEKREAQYLSKAGRRSGAPSQTRLGGEAQNSAKIYSIKGEKGPHNAGNLSHTAVKFSSSSKRITDGEEQKGVLEGLVQQGRLGQYVVRTGRERTRARAEASGREERNRDNSGHSRSPRPAMAGYRGTISTISGGEELRVEQDIQRKRKAHQSYQILTGANLTPLGERRKGCAITFQEKDRRYEAAGDEPMVISVVVEDFKIERVLIDQGSSANILYGSTYRRMGLSGLKETPGCLYGFSGERVPIKGTVELDTVFGEGSNAKMIPVLYTVIEAEASYNIIMGRPTLYRLKAIVSTYHLCMKYPTGEGVRAVWADSGMAKRCYEDSLRVGQRRSAINTLSLELDPRCHDE
ncbi:hypothetical protein CR513_35485, partial [Mucuna pruriens]